jgi:AcrR family transcriptional regulator
MIKNDGIQEQKRVRRDRKQEILENATRLFAEYGYQGTSFALVAEAVGLTEQGVLHYFPSKVHLLQAVLEHHEQKMVDRYALFINGNQQHPINLFAMLQDVYAENEKIPGLVQLFTVLVGESIREDHPSHAYFVDRYRRGREIYARQLGILVKNAGRKDVDFKELAAVVMAVMDGLQIQWLLDPEHVDLPGAFRLFSRIVERYLE